MDKIFAALFLLVFVVGTFMPPQVLDSIFNESENLRQLVMWVLYSCGLASVIGFAFIVGRTRKQAILLKKHRDQMRDFSQQLRTKKRV